MRDVKSNFATEQSNSDAEKGCVAAKRRLADLALGVLIVWCVRGGSRAKGNEKLYKRRMATSHGLGADRKEGKMRGLFYYIWWLRGLLLGRGRCKGGTCRRARKREEDRKILKEFMTRSMVTMCNDFSSGGQERKRG